MGEGTAVKLRGYLFFIVAFAIILGGCNNSEKVEEEDESGLIEEIIDQEVSTQDELSIETFHTDSLGWGYDIYRNGKKIVHQYHIPAVSGLHGFDSEADALKLANLVAEKINNGMKRPSVSLEEIDSLNILIKK